MTDSRASEEGWMWYSRALEASRSGHSPDATEAAMRALAQAAHDPPLAASVGLFFEDAGSLEVATDAYEMAVMESPSFADAHEGRGRVALRRGDVGRAMEAFMVAKAVRPDVLGPRLGLALVHERAGNLETAARELEEADRRWPGNVNVLRALGRVLGAQGRLERCIDMWRRVVSLLPADREATSALGVALSRFGDHHAAIPILAKVTEGRDATAGDVGNLGSALLAADRPAEAVEVLTRGVAASPDQPQLRLNLGCALLELDRVAEAIQELRAVTVAHPEWDVALLNLGIALRRAGYSDEACETLERALQLSPSDSDIIRELLGAQAEVEVMSSVSVSWPTASGLSATMTGELASFSLPDLLEFLRVHASAGELRIIGERGEGRLLLHAGNLVGATAPGIAPLGERLLSEGALTQEALDTAIRDQETSGGDLLGRVLARKGLADPAKVRRALARQVIDVLRELTAWTEGRFELHEARDGAASLRTGIAVDTRGALMEVMRLADERRRLGEGVALPIPLPSLTPR